MDERGMTQFLVNSKWFIKKKISLPLYIDRIYIRVLMFLFILQNAQFYLCRYVVSILFYFLIRLKKKLQDYKPLKTCFVMFNLFKAKENVYTYCTDFRLGFLYPKYLGVLFKIWRYFRSSSTQTTQTKNILDTWDLNP